MKKRLFLSSAIMTGVLAVALSTGTYAWYSTSAAGSAANLAAISKTVATSKSTGADVGTSYAKYDVTWVEVTNVADTVLVDNAGQEWVYVNNQLVKAKDGGQKYTSMTVKLTFEGLYTNEACTEKVTDPATLAGAAGSYTYYLHDDNARVHTLKAAPTENFLAADAEIAIPVTLTATTTDGSVTLAGESEAIPFFLTFQGTTADGAATVDTDPISVTLKVTNSKTL